MNDLLKRIAAAQREAGERVVVDDLREKGLLDVAQAHEDPLVHVDVPRLRLLGQRMEAEFYLRRAYSVEDIQQIKKAADEIAGLRNLLRCAYEDVPGWVGDAAVMLGRVPRE